MYPAREIFLKVNLDEFLGKVNLDVNLDECQQINIYIYIYILLN